MRECEVVITGIGVLCSAGIGREALWSSLCAGRTGVATLQHPYDNLQIRLGSEVQGFEPKKHIQQRKMLKIMSRDMQLGVAASHLAWRDAQLGVGQQDPERVGVVFGADWICTPADETLSSYLGCLEQGRFQFSLWATRGYEGAFPLGFLKTLPNMAACHASIELDARGPNNTHHQCEVSSLMAIAEGTSCIRRGAADVMLVGGTSSMLDPYDFAHYATIDELSRRNGEVVTTPRPFDAARDGQVRGEGAAVLVLESAAHARARGARPLARIAGYGAGSAGREPPSTGRGLEVAIRAALRAADCEPHILGHLNAHGLGTLDDDRTEAAVLHRLCGDVPVLAAKSYFGNLGAASGAVEAAVSVLALEHGEVPYTLHYSQPDPNCPVRVIRDEPLRAAPPATLLVNATRTGQAAALLLQSAS